MSQAEKGSVYLVGAGPGSLDLLTLRAHTLIGSATCLLHDDLVSAEVLAVASPGAIVRNVGKRCGAKTITQEEINAWMIEYARAGESVVRLKSGDPLLFGRAAEEMEALAQAGVPFEVVPGVSTGFAAAALAGLPLTGRITNSRVLFATRHLAAGATHGLAGIGPEVTLVLYMPGKDYAAIAAELAANGWSGATRCVVASALGTAAQRQLSCLLRELAQVAPLPSPALMLFFPPGPDAQDSPARGNGAGRFGSFGLG
jgi:uroporphyrin-III C-methyltransferase